MNEPRQRTVHISSTGRMNLPADMRRALGLSGPGCVILVMDDNGIRITTSVQALNRIKALAAPYRPTKGLASEQLIEDRRREAQHEDNEAENREND